MRVCDTSISEGIGNTPRNDLNIHSFGIALLYKLGHHEAVIPNSVRALEAYFCITYGNLESHTTQLQSS